MCTAANTGQLPCAGLSKTNHSDTIIKVYTVSILVWTRIRAVSPDAVFAYISSKCQKDFHHQDLSLMLLPHPFCRYLLH